MEETAAPLPGGEKKVLWTTVFHGLGEEERLVCFAVYPTPSPEEEVGYGFQLRMGALKEVLAKVSEGVLLLPPALTKGRDPRDFVSFTIHDRMHREIYRSYPQYTSSHQASEMVGESYGGIHGVVTLREEAADFLVIGGLPGSRLPTILGLLVLASALVIAAIFQIRREQELARLRTDFVSSVSHQLRTPLAQIRMFGETLLLGRVRSEDEERRSLEIIVKEAQSLTHQVDNVLLFSRAQRQDIQLSPRPTRLTPLVQEVLESFCPLAEAKGCRVEGNLEEDLSALADPVAVRQILLNLLENAVKYGPRSQVIQVTLRRGAPRRVQLLVEDEGEGIPPDRREEVFFPYSRLARDRDSAVAGSGIGLAVALELVQGQKGAIWIEDSTKGGARFVVELPEAPVGAPTQTGSSVP
jgi:signal transduction histidine kinase